MKNQIKVAIHFWTAIHQTYFLYQSMLRLKTICQWFHMIQFNDIFYFINKNVINLRRLFEVVIKNRNYFFFFHLNLFQLRAMPTFYTWQHSHSLNDYESHVGRTVIPIDKTIDAQNVMSTCESKLFNKWKQLYILIYQLIAFAGWKFI